MKTKSIAISMRNLRQKRSAQLKAEQKSGYTIPNTMVNSIRQSMRIEGYDISASDTRKAINSSLKNNLNCVKTYS